MKKNNLLEGAYYSKEPLFAQIDEIMKYFDEDGNIIADELNVYQVDFLNKLKEEFAANYKLQNETNTINIKENINKLVDNFYKEFGLENTIKPNITIVDKFPEPFSDRNYKAMNFNEEQSKKFNVPKGIYILKKFAIHGICEIMLAHEVMHYIIGEFTKVEEQLEQCPFYEEGTVDFMGLYLLLKYKIVDEICVRNWLLFGRGLCTSEYIGSLYFNENKQIQYIAREYGINYIKDIIKKGTNEIRNIRFFNIESNKYDGNDEILNKLLKMYDYVFSCFSLKFDEYYLYTKTINSKINLNEIIIDDLNIIEVAKRLEKKGLIYILDDTLYNPNNCILDGIKIVLK